MANKEDLRYTDPIKEIEENETWRKERIKISNRINIYLNGISKNSDWRCVEKEYHKLEKVITGFLDPIYKKLDRYECWAGFYNVFPNIEKLNEQWQSLKMNQEREKFHKGDFNADLGDNYGRYFSIKKDVCVLCGAKDLCFCFEDNESYGEESLCKGCITVIAKKMGSIKEVE